MFCVFPTSSRPSMRWIDQPIELDGDPRRVVRVVRNGRPTPLRDIIRMDTLYGIDAETERSMDALGIAIGELVLKRFPVASHHTLTEIAVSCILRSLQIKFVVSYTPLGQQFDLHRFGRPIPIDPALEHAITRLLTTTIHTITTPTVPTVSIALKPPSGRITIHF